jgi:hypothetical protein
MMELSALLIKHRDNFALFTVTSGNIKQIISHVIPHLMPSLTILKKNVIFVVSILVTQLRIVFLDTFIVKC